ncbi:ATP SYNTHASE EPSILON CHAIN [Mycoplasmopsis pulmonis]|uniref:ATP synthase epsilon chain n=1 Tax=Mycoplasmopsis pulmonis (strain UAB CTIP) TaxID=272635 RepID=ATPE_MYCPU|nr:ATP synthase F1 subunit epsilon [Mycoplasmopsis pulmonis]Q98QU6.1 RecName: Full=ATP synthase epsilon chain; AltName: Full=ATP synthase F1 sector epsilon subunit; AltName: Full=F-ATPase epsilon subunit [Mycoplasmopsis pulmonis UAB CTIP]MDZ7293224.1 ATP synthase F1 subunit epsilon [Mycoplasmopsis pulmonis]CAC13438.1 ATP SYNTHASE EPSILON CHAIN [Mycoplasmopsis pulmonis]VEU68026.1 ATP synthase subunit epsilon [Mycoplasmopsis pulmonis]
MQLQLIITTPNGIFFNEKVDIVTVVTAGGHIGIQYGHQPLISTIEISELHINTEGHKDYRICSINGGLLYVEKDKANIITGAIEFKEDIDIEKARREHDYLVEILSNSKNKDSDYFRNELKLKKVINRLKISSNSTQSPKK